MFSSGQELANLAASSDLLHHSWAAIRELYRDTNPSGPTITIKHKVYEQTPIGTIIAFVSSPPCTTQHLQGEGGGDLVSSETLIRDNFLLFEFVSTKVNPSFSIHRAAVTRFASIQHELKSLKDLLGKTRPVIVTGHSIGGSIASLYTLWMLESITPKDKRPLCITFGAPLLGDNGFQQAIFERPKWNSCFLHVASNQDPIPKLFASPRNALTVESTSHTSIYKPFGTFLLCSESGCACFEEPESVLDLMMATSSDSVGNRGSNERLQTYEEILKKFKCGAIYRGISQLGERNVSPLRTGIIIQIEAIKVESAQQQHENGDINSLVAKIEQRAEDRLASKRNAFDPDNKLNKMKINMAYLEWFKKVSESTYHVGYYDAFKYQHSTSREEIVKWKNSLTQYWDKMVQEVKKVPQKEGMAFQLRWLGAGTNYRRMVEPLDIAEWYKKGKKDYLAAGRSEHYKLLEKWIKDDMPVQNQSNANVRKKACSLTEDSCFWAHVEEAFISCQLLKDGASSSEVKETSMENLVGFENYVMGLITNYTVSPEIFLKQSSFREWWATYEKIKGTSYHSSLADFMRRRKYVQYVEDCCGMSSQYDHIKSLM